MPSPIRTLVLAAAIVAAPLALSTPAAAATPASKPAPAKQAPMHAQRQSIFDKLDLNDSQRDSIKAAMKQNFEKLRPQMQSLRAKQEAFRKAEPGSKDYQSHVNDLAEAEASFARARTLQEGALRTQIYKILTPEQRTKLQKLLAEQRARIQKMRAEAARRQAAPPASH